MRRRNRPRQQLGPPPLPGPLSEPLPGAELASPQARPSTPCAGSQPGRGVSPPGRVARWPLVRPRGVGEAGRGVLTLPQGMEARGSRPQARHSEPPPPTLPQARLGRVPAPPGTLLLPECPPPPPICGGRPTGKRISRLCDLSRLSVG